MKRIEEFAVGVHEDQIVFVIEKGLVELEDLESCTYTIKKAKSKLSYMVISNQGGDAILAIGDIDDDKVALMSQSEVYVGFDAGFNVEGHLIARQ